MKRQFLLPILIFSFLFSYGQDFMPGPELVIYADQLPVNRYIPPAGGGSLATATAIINVTFTGTWPVDAQNAFEFAASVWEASITSPIIIEISADWTLLSSTILGSANASQLVRNFTSSDPSFLPDTWFVLSLANKLSSTDIDTSVVEIEARFNSSFSNWYFGTDGATGTSQYDFVTVVLHEIGHGLGFAPSTRYGSGGLVYGYIGDPTIYDRFILDGSGTRLTDFPTETPSAALTAFLTSNDLWWDGAEAVAANGGATPQIYAPASFSSGSSISHFDEAYFPAGNLNSLMTPMLGTAEAIHNTGPVTDGLLIDIGWDLSTGIYENQLAEGLITVFPNPVQDYLGLKNDAEAVMECIEIINPQGQKLAKIQKESPDGWVNKISLSCLPNGIYFAKVTLRNGQFACIKFVKN